MVLLSILSHGFWSECFDCLSEGLMNKLSKFIKLSREYCIQTIAFNKMSKFLDMCRIFWKNFLNIFCFFKEAKNGFITWRDKCLENWIFKHLSNEILGHASGVCWMWRAESKEALENLLFVLGCETIIFGLKFEHAITSCDYETWTDLSFHIDIEKSIHKLLISNCILWKIQTKLNSKYLNILSNRWNMIILESIPKTFVYLFNNVIPNNALSHFSKFICVNLWIKQL